MQMAKSRSHFYEIVLVSRKYDFQIVMLFSWIYETVKVEFYVLS